MRISWGIKIGVLYAGFVGLIVTLVVLCMNQKVELESKDYYAKELAYQSRINATQNANALSESIEYSISDNTVTLSAPKEMMGQGFSGHVFFYRPSDSSLDFQIPLQFNANGEQVISDNHLKKGAYKIELSWKNGDKEYYKEGVINIK